MVILNEAVIESSDSSKHMYISFYVCIVDCSLLRKHFAALLILQDTVIPIWQAIYLSSLIAFRYFGIFFLKIPNTGASHNWFESQHDFTTLRAFRDFTPGFHHTGPVFCRRPFLLSLEPSAKSVTLRTNYVCRTAHMYIALYSKRNSDLYTLFDPLPEEPKCV